MHSSGPSGCKNTKGVQPGEFLSGCTALVMFLCVQFQNVFPFSVTVCLKIGLGTRVPSFSEAALGQVASEGWEPSLQAVLMGAGLTTRKFSFSLCSINNLKKFALSTKVVPVPCICLRLVLSVCLCPVLRRSGGWNAVFKALC